MAALASHLDPCGYALAEALAAILSERQVHESADAVYRLLEKPPESKLGDFALPCFRFAKGLGKKPQDVALHFRDHLTKERCDWVERIEVVGAFLNIFVDQAKLANATIPDVLTGRYFESFKGQNADCRVMIEYSQPNTHKEFHVGHARNVMLGNSLCRLFRYCGYPVTAANYFGDEGTHIATVLWHLKSVAATPPTEQRGAWLGSMYVAAKRRLAEASPDDKKAYEQEISRILASIESKQGEDYELWRKTRQWSLDDFGEIYQWLDVHFDILFYESDVSEESQRIVDEYLAKGIFVEDQGAIGVDLKDYKLGFMIVRKRDGNTLYATKDLALARRKFDEHGIDRSIYVVADEQKHHFQQVFKTLELMGFENAKRCYHLSYGLVVLPEGKMSSRDGTSVGFIELRQVITDELNGILQKYAGEWSSEELAETAHRLCDGSMKYGMLATDPNKKIVFDLKNWTSFEGNSGPYLMYSYTRTRSILAKAQAEPQVKEMAYGEPSEQELIRLIYDFNKVVQQACESYSPATLANHLYGMCKAFNRFYADVSVLKAENESLKNARLALVAAFSKSLREGLSLLGIRPPERM